MASDAAAAGIDRNPTCNAWTTEGSAFRRTAFSSSLDERPCWCRRRRGLRGVERANPSAIVIESSRPGEVNIPSNNLCTPGTVDCTAGVFEFLARGVDCARDGAV
jgi:hypothetical protein